MSFCFLVPVLLAAEESLATFWFLLLIGVTFALALTAFEGPEIDAAVRLLARVQLLCLDADGEQDDDESECKGDLHCVKLKA